LARPINEIVSRVDPLVLVDPQNGGSYMYEKTQEGFRLYSTGPNGKDENGEHTWNGPDDWPSGGTGRAKNVET
jgi:hypothetical protein